MKKQRTIVTDFFGTKWLKIYTCSGTKLTQYLTIALMLLTLGSCNKPLTPWEVYCEAYGVDKNNPTESEENFYLDCWVGSAEQDEMMEDVL